MIQTFSKINRVSGTLTLPGDKSIAHRALLISSLADGKSVISNLPNSDDLNSTIKCLESLGIKVEKKSDAAFVYGKGFKGYYPPNKSLNAGNSGTTARLLAGILSAQNFESIIEGDKSLSSRPMKRIIEPLMLMGCNIKGENDEKLPLQIYPVEKISAIKYNLPVPSAQIKSSILLAGLHSEDESSVIEVKQSRNHTENLLGLKVVNDDDKIISTVSKKNYPVPNEYFIPGDISTAMFFVVLALLTQNSELNIKNISLNPTRTIALNLLMKMGGNIEVDLKGESNNEPYGDLIVKSSKLSNVKIDTESIPLIIDEIPILSVAGIFSEGFFEIKSASELRVKESDRIKSLATNFSIIGLDVEEFSDGFRISGGIKYSGKPFQSFGDHRVAMTFAILSLLLEKGGKVDGFESVRISNPDFITQVASISN